MKRNVQILLLFAVLVSTAAFAEEKETMEERKRRIARKYLRERMDVTYSEEVVPDDESTAAALLAADGLEEAEVEIERQGPVTQVPPPVMMPPPRKANNNWLLSEDPDSENPYDDPYAQREDESGRSDWTEWSIEQDYSSYFDVERDSSFIRRNDPASQEEADRYDVYRRDSLYDRRNPFRQQAPAGYQQPWGQQRAAYGTSGSERPGAYNPSYDQSDRRYTYPYQSGPWTGTLSGTDRQRTDGTAYRNPYASQQETPLRPGAAPPYVNPYQNLYRQGRTQQDSYNDPNQAYQRQDPFQQWNRNQPRQYDPMGDDAYIEEMMPGTRR